MAARSKKNVHNQSIIKKKIGTTAKSAYMIRFFFFIYLQVIHIVHFGWYLTYLYIIYGQGHIFLSGRFYVRLAASTFYFLHLYANIIYSIHLLCRTRIIYITYYANTKKICMLYIYFIIAYATIAMRQKSLISISIVLFDCKIYYINYKYCKQYLGPGLY